MALLTSVPRGVHVFAGAVAALAAAGAGCALLGGGGGPARFAFSHRIHVDGQELECENCHESAAVDEDPGMPYLDTCWLCHAELDEEKPPDRTAESLFDADEQFLAARVCRVSDEVIFSHLLHVEALGDCAACHAEIIDGSAVEPAAALLMADCTDCHAALGVASDCATCHLVERADRAPASHSLGWTREHGPTVRARLEGTRNDCSICHTEASCNECHQIMPPRNHTTAFRRGLHGIHASMERQSCDACHQPATCDACHQTTAPMSHVGPWGGTKSTHCTACHLPLQYESCSLCHKALTSHFLATPKPSWHTPFMDCRQCHGMGQALPHVDNGDDCNSCHF
jgi:hypothetical protein